jgi:hypothetical protein
VADGREHRLHPDSTKAKRLSGLITTAVLAGLASIGVAILLLLGRGGRPGLLLLPLAWLGATALLGGFVLWWPGVAYRHVSYIVSERGLSIRRGVLWRTINSVPRNRVQHTDVSEGPIERMFGLATLVVYTAGTEHASISLAGLGRERAFRIRDHLIGGGADDAV